MTKRVYRCEFCNKVYDEEEEAHACEESHVKSGEVSFLTPGAHGLVDELGRWPDKIILLTKDHKAAVYGRTGSYVPTGKMVQRALGAWPACQPGEAVDADTKEIDG